jgi:hypothetical protein
VIGCATSAQEDEFPEDEHHPRKNIQEVHREDCDKLAHKGGMCYSHGATAIKCKREGCKNNAKRLGLCKSHGAD